MLSKKRKTASDVSAPSVGAGGPLFRSIKRNPTLARRRNLHREVGRKGVSLVLKKQISRTPCEILLNRAQLVGNFRRVFDCGREDGREGADQAPRDDHQP